MLRLHLHMHTWIFISANGTKWIGRDYEIGRFVHLCVCLSVSLSDCTWIGGDLHSNEHLLVYCLFSDRWQSGLVWRKILVSYSDSDSIDHVVTACYTVFSSKIGFCYFMMLIARAHTVFCSSWNFELSHKICSLCRIFILQQNFAQVEKWLVISNIIG